MQRNIINYMHTEAELLLLSISSEILELLLNCTNVHLDTLQLYRHSLLTHGWAHPRVGTEVPELLK